MRELNALFTSIGQEWRICNANNCNTLTTRLIDFQYATGVGVEGRELFLNMFAGHENGRYPQLSMHLNHYLKAHFGSGRDATTCDRCGIKSKPAVSRSQVIDGPEILIITLGQVHAPPHYR